MAKGRRGRDQVRRLDRRDWQSVAEWILATIECPVCSGWGLAKGVKIGDTYKPCTRCAGTCRVEPLGPSNDRIPLAELRMAKRLAGGK